MESIIALPNLTHQVVKTSRHYSAFRECAELWECSYNSLPVYAKVLRGLSNDPADRVQFAKNFKALCAKWSDLSGPDNPHPYIHQFLGVVYDFGPMPGIVSPFYTSGNVLDYLEKDPDADRLNLIRQVASGLEYLHDNGLVHGNIKAANVLIDQNGQASLHDAGLLPLILGSSFTILGLPPQARWMAPEVLLDTSTFSAQSDMWSFGMTVLEIYTEAVPFSYMFNDALVILDLVDGKIPRKPDTSTLSNELWALCQACWNKDPFKRISLGQFQERLDNIRSGIRSYYASEGAPVARL